MLRLSRRSGPYVVTVFTTPTPLRAGRADVSVLVQDEETGRIVDEVEVSVRLAAVGGGEAAASYAATRRRATNKLLKAAAVDFPAPGSWTVVAGVSGPKGFSRVRFNAEVLAAPPSWIQRLPWIGWPLAPIAVFGLREIAVHASSSARARRRRLAAK